MRLGTEAFVKGTVGAWQGHANLYSNTQTHTHTHTCINSKHTHYVTRGRDEHKTKKETGESDSGKLIFDVNVKFMWKCNAPIINIFDR